MSDAAADATTAAPATPKKRLKTAVETKKVKVLTITEKNVMDLLAAAGVASSDAGCTSFKGGPDGFTIEWTE